MKEKKPPPPMNCMNNSWALAGQQISVMGEHEYDTSSLKSIQLREAHRHRHHWTKPKERRWSIVAATKWAEAPAEPTDKGRR